MKKDRFMRILLVAIFSLIISACSVQKDVNVKSIVIIEETVPDFIVAGKFDEAGIQALVTYEDNTTEKIYVNSNFFKDAYQEYINNVGEYEIEILFKGASTKLKVKIVDAEEQYEVKFFNGLNELVSMQVVEKGKDAVAPSGQSHQIYGYEFIGWDRKFTNVTEDINVYGIYAKIGESEDVGVNYEMLLLNAAENMRNGDLNILDVWELSSKRIEITNYYNDSNLDKVVTKVTEGNRKINYNKYSKKMNESGSYVYVYEKYDSSGFYPEVTITADEFEQYDIYGYVKKIISSTDVLICSTKYSLNRTFYKLEAVVPNSGDGGHASDTYEFLFDEEQIVYLKHFMNNVSSSDEVENILTWSKYYTVDSEKNEKIVFPSDVNLGNIVSDVFNNDVVIKTEEMRDIFVVVEEVRNDANNRAALIIRGNTETYMWDKDPATYYTKEEFGLNDSAVQVYKTTDSIERYGATYYYKWKDISSNASSVVGKENGSISFIFEVGESSSMRAHKVEFIVLDNRLIGFERYYYSGSALVHIDKTTFNYENVEVIVPSALIGREASAIVE